MKSCICLLGVPAALGFRWPQEIQSSKGKRKYCICKLCNMFRNENLISSNRAKIAHLNKRLCKREYEHSSKLVLHTVRAGQSSNLHQLTKHLAAHSAKKAANSVSDAMYITYAACPHALRARFQLDFTSCFEKTLAQHQRKHNEYAFFQHFCTQDQLRRPLEWRVSR